MVLDLFGKKRRGKPYTKMGLVKLAKTSATYGTSFRDMKRVLKEANLAFKHIRRPEQLLVKGLFMPMIALIRDPGHKRGEELEWHYVVVHVLLDTWKTKCVLVQDPYYGSELYYPVEDLFSRMGSRPWLIEISDKSVSVPAQYCVPPVDVFGTEAVSLDGEPLEPTPQGTFWKRTKLWAKNLLQRAFLATTIRSQP